MSLPSYAMNQMGFPEMYERWLIEPLFRPWAEVLLGRAKVGPGDRLLDVACGTGIVARLAKKRVGGGKVVGVDLSPGMLAVASQNAPEIDWREGNAESLPVQPGEVFDVVTCQQGLQFVPDKSAAAREMRRVLVPGGRLAVASWRPVAENPYFYETQLVAERHLGPILDMRHSFGDAGELKSLLTDAGFRTVTVETLSLLHRFPEAGVFVRMNTMALVGMSEASAGMTDEERRKAVEDIVRDSAEAVAPFVEGEVLAIQLSTNMATASA